MTQAGIAPATFRFVTQLLNYCTTAVPHCSHTNTKLNKMKNLVEMDLLNVSAVPHNQAVHFLRLTFVISEILHYPQPTIARKTRE